MGVCRRYHSRRDRPALASDDHWTLTVFSTYSNFNLVDIRMFDDIRRHAIVFVCSIFSRLLVSICNLESLATRSVQK